MTSRRVVIALGGNAMTGPDGSATPGAQRDAHRARPSGHIADVVASGVEVVLTHGNGPQVGNLLVKNELAAHVVPPVPLDWNVAQTQATIAFTLADELDAALAARGPARSAPPAWSPARSSTSTTRTSASRPSRSAASSRARRRERFVALGQVWEDRGEKGWRRVVASPEPRSVVDSPAIHALAAAGFVVVCAGGGGIPVTRRRPGRRRPARRRGRHRQGPHRRDPGPRGRRRHPRHRHRRPERDGRLRHAVRPPAGPGHRRRAARARRRRPVRPRQHGPQGRRRPPLRRGRRHAAPSSRPWNTSPTPSPATTPAPS